MSTAILAHGKNWELPVPSNPANIKLSIESRITAEAAGALFAGGIGDLIIFSTGFTAGPGYPSEASELRKAMRGHFAEDQVPLSRTVLEEASYDTVGNLQKVNERMPELGVDSVILLSIGYHLPRVKKLARILDMPVSAAYASDQVIRKRYGDVDHLYARMVLAEAARERSTKPLVRTAASYALEAAGWSLSLVDPESKNLAKYATLALRH